VTVNHEDIQADTTTRLRVGLAHDWLVGVRGGELVLDRLARLFGPTTMYTLVHDSTAHTIAIDACEIRTSPLQRLPGAAGSLRRWYLPLMPWAVGALGVDRCDVLISTSSAVMKSIRPPDGVPHICYCHSPARYIWEQGGDYRHGAHGRLRSLGLRALRGPFQRWDRRTTNHVSTFIANSTHTANRIARCYDRDAIVVHPPVRTAVFTPGDVQRGEVYLVVAALEPYKRVDLVLDAAARRGDLRVRIVGDGSQAKALRAMAPSNVEFLGRIDDEALRAEYRAARALIFPQTEDFGIVAVEAQATGCPVVAYGAGGALDSVTDETGVFFEEQTPEALIDALLAFEDRSFDAAVIRAHAEQFGAERFDAAMEAVVSATVGQPVEPRDGGE